MSTLTKPRAKKTVRKSLSSRVVAAKKTAKVKNFPPGAIKLSEWEVEMMEKLSGNDVGPLEK